MLSRAECSEPPLVQKEHPFQGQIDRMAYMKEDRDAFAAFIDDKMDYFGDIFEAALAEMDAKIEEEADYYRFLREGA